MLKFLSSKNQLSGEGFKGMFEFMRHVIKGDQALNKAAVNVMREGVEVIPMSMAPKADAREALEKSLEVAQNDPMSLLDRGEQLAYYMPNEGTALGALGAKAVSYLLSLKPRPNVTSPLDDVAPADPVAQAAYDRALDIAQQPLTVLASIKEGSLTSDDVKTLVNVYPNLYARFQEKLMAQVIDIKAKGEEIPYSVKLGLSVFAQMPLDSSMTGPSIMSAQPPPAQQAPQQQGMSESSATKLNKLEQLAYTPNQAAQARQSGAQS
jgi:hypothetical protein